MADNEICSVPMMTGWAYGTLEEWLQGYTDVQADGLQRRITVVDSEEDCLSIRVERQHLHGGYDRKDKHYRIRITVEEVDEDGIATG